MLLNNWGDVLTLSFQNLWVGVVNFVPNLVIALVILILGWLVGALLGRAIWQVFKSLKVDDALRRAGFEFFLQDVVLGYLPRVLAAALVLLVAGVIGDVTGRVVVTAAKTAGVESAHFVGAVARWAIWVFAVLVALSHLGIAAAFSQTLFTGIVIAVSLALGLSFGLGGQEAASRFIESLRNEMSGKHNG